MKAFFVSVPHSGEKVPEETPWLHNLPEPTLMRDVDRYVDLLYRPGVEELQVPFVVTEWNRYVVDLNRLPEDVDADSVIGDANPSGTHPRGIHWTVTTIGEKLMPEPISKEAHDHLVEKYFRPFHAQVVATYDKLRQQGATKIYHLDAHSMPSFGTEAHKDPGKERPEIVVSDVGGTSCEAWFLDLVVESYKKAGFEVAVNWPYLGGRVTQTYGHPDRGQHAIQVEMKRAIYMDETTKQLKAENLVDIQSKVKQALQSIYAEIPEF